MDDPGPVVDGTAVEEAGSRAGSPAPGALAVTQTRSVLKPLDVQEVAKSMEQYQAGLQSLLNKSDWQDAGRGESFVKKSGWRKIATWFGLSVEVLRDRVERDEQGQPLRATVIARAVAPNGRYMDGDGHCSVTESRFARNKGKLENDLIGTATTRAKNRAIADLVGMGAVSAEETDGQPPPPPFGEAASEELQEKTVLGLAALLGDDAPVGALIEKLVKDGGGYLPRISARACALVAAAYIEANKERTDGDRDSTPGDDAGQPEGDPEPVADAEVVPDPEGADHPYD